MVPEGWEKHLVGKICSSIVPGRNKPKVFNGSIPWVTTPEIKGRYIPSKHQQNFISADVLKECGGKIVPRGAVVMAAVGELGLVAISSEEVVLNQQLHAFVCTDLVNNEYLAYWLSSQKQYMESLASKTTIPYLNKTNCESIPVLLPPLPEQRKIAKILSTWDKAISTTERLINNSKQQKKALMQQLLTGKKRLLDDSGRVFEGEWEEVRLGQITEFIKDGTHGTHKRYETGIPMLSAANITKSHKISFKGAPFISGNDYKKIHSKYEISSGDILLTVVGTLGRVAIVSEDRKFTLQRSVAIIRVSNKADNQFLMQLFSSNDFNHLLVRKSNSTAQAGVYLGELARIKILLPPIEEQHKIASVLTNADKEIKTLEQQLSNLKQEKKALMQQLLTGKRRVKLDDTAAA